MSNRKGLSRSKNLKLVLLLPRLQSLVRRVSIKQRRRQGVHVHRSKERRRDELQENLRQKTRELRPFRQVAMYSPNFVFGSSFLYFYHPEQQIAYFYVLVRDSFFFLVNFRNQIFLHCKSSMQVGHWHEIFP